MSLPQPPEGILDPKQPWWAGKVGEKTWMILKAKLTGGEAFGTGYSSAVNLTSADADTLIENLKKDPRGYPQMDDGGGGMRQMENIIAYQEWLREEYLEKPFSKKTDAKIEEAAIESRMKEIDAERKSRRAQEKKEQSPKEEIQQVVDNLVNKIPVDEEEVSAEIIDVLPYIAPAAAEIEVPESIEDDTSTPTEEEKSESPPTLLSIDIQNLIDKYSDELGQISSVLNYQTSLVRKVNSQRRSLFFNLGIANFILEQQVENYTEAIKDLEFRAEEKKTKQVSKKSKEKLEATIVPSKTDAVDAPSAPVAPEPQQPSYAWYDPRGWAQSPTKRSEGAISTGTSLLPGKIITPGIYDSPTVGQLLPGMAVIPYNRNYGKKILNVDSQIEGMNAVGAAMGAIKNTFLAAAVNSIGLFVKSTGGLSSFFGSFLEGSVDTLSRTFGIPKHEVERLLGLDEYNVRRSREDFFKIWKESIVENNWIFGGGTSGTTRTTPGSGKVFEGVATTFSVGSGQNLSQLPAWLPFHKADARSLTFTSGFGMRLSPISGELKKHNGLDIAAPIGIPVISPFSGKVSDVDHNPGTSGYGNFVEIEHEQPKVFTLYAHLNEIANGMSIGSPVAAGQEVGKVGNTGSSTGSHLHWEVRPNKGMSQGGTTIDPVGFTRQYSVGSGSPPVNPKTPPPNPTSNGRPSTKSQLEKIGQHKAAASLESGGTVGSFQWGGILKNLQNLIPNIPKPRGLSIRNVAAGFTGMAKDGFDAVMGGDKFKLGRVKPQILGRGAYSAPTLAGAERYAGTGGSLGGTQTPGGVVKTIVPGGARRINFIEPQAAVKPITFDKGRVLATKLLNGEYANSPLANKLRNQLITGVAGPGIDLLGDALKVLRLGGRVLGAAGPVLDLAFPDAVGQYSQLSGPNAYYNAPGYKGPSPLTVTPTRRNPIVINLPPSTSSGGSSSIVPQPAGSSTITYVPIPISTKAVMSVNQMRRL